MKAVKSGVGIAEDSFIFAISPAGAEVRVMDNGHRMHVVKNAIPGRMEEAEIKEDVVTYRPQCLDVGVWAIGGSAVLLRLVELAEVSCQIGGVVGGCCSLLAVSVPTRPL